MKKTISEGSELDGYEGLRPEDQAKVIKAWQEGHVADEDIPETARKPVGEDGEEEEKPKKAKRAPAKKKAAAAGSDGEAEERPKRKAKTAAAKVRFLFFKWLHSFLLIMVYIYRRPVMRTTKRTKRMRKKSPRGRGLLPRRKLRLKKKRHPRNVHQKRRKKLFSFIYIFGFRSFCNLFLFFFI